MPAVLGIARGASFFATLQPRHGVTADLDRKFYVLDLLVMDALDWLSSINGPDHAGNQPAVSVLDPHTTGPTHGPAGIAHEHAFAPSCASRTQPAIPSSQPCSN